MNQRQSRSDSEYCAVLCTCPQKAIAKQIAHAAVSERLAACVNIIDKVSSVYLWQGEIQQDDEVQLVFKTSHQHTDALFKLVVDMHPYDVPEWLIIDISTGSTDYLSWLNNTLK